MALLVAENPDDVVCNVRGDVRAGCVWRRQELLANDAGLRNTSYSDGDHRRDPGGVLASGMDRGKRIRRNGALVHDRDVGPLSVDRLSDDIRPVVFDRRIVFVERDRSSKTPDG